MPNPDTSAQGAPAASQEAEARGAVLKAYDDSGESLTFETDEVCDAAFITALDAYAAAIRASERERYAALVDAARAFDAFIEVVDSGMTVFPFDPADPNSEQNTYDRVQKGLRAALAALEEAGSAQ